MSSRGGNKYMLIIKRIQTAIFVRNFQIANEYEKSKILLELNNKVGDIFSGNPTLIPVPSDAPGDIPRIVINSNENLYSANIAPNRIDIFSNLDKNLDENNTSLFENHKQNSLKLFNFIKTYSASAIINRVGFSLVCESTQADSVNFVKSNFFKESKVDNIKELSFRYNKSSVLNESGFNIEFNNIVEVFARNNNSIGFIADVNTVAENMNIYNFDSTILEKIINHAIQKEKDLISNFPKID